MASLGGLCLSAMARSAWQDQRGEIGVARSDWREGVARMPDRESERCKQREMHLIGGERKNELNKPNSVWH